MSLSMSTSSSPTKQLTRCSAIAGFCVFAALFGAGCGNGNATGDGGGTSDMAVTPPDMTAVPDIAMTPPDMTVIPPDMTKPTYSTIMLLQEVTVTYPVMTDGGTQNISGKILVPVVSSGQAGLPNTHDFDDRNAFGLGCFSDHYNLVNGKKPVADVNAGTVVMTGYSTTNKTIGGATVPDEIDCVVGMSGAYQCGFGMAMNGMVGPDPTTAVFPPSAVLIPTGRAIRFKYSGGILGTYDSMNIAVATETVAVTDDLTTIKYDPAADTTLHYSCPDGMMGACPTGAVLVQLVATSKNVGEMGYPGADYGVTNCVGLTSSNKIVIKKEVLTAMYGGSNAIKQVYTRLVRGSLPPGGQKDDKGNAVTLAVGRGVTGFAPR